MSVLQPDRDLSKLKPEMKSRVECFLGKCKNSGVDIFVTEGFRSKARQLYLWSFGRTLSPGLEKSYLGYDDPNVESHPEKSIVTKTLSSNHMIGEAIDIAFKGGEPYPKNMAKWDEVYDIAESCGLSSLYRRTGYFDLPHLELDRSVTSGQMPLPLQVAEQVDSVNDVNHDSGSEDHWAKIYEDLLMREKIVVDPKNLDEPPTRGEMYKIVSYILKKLFKD